MSLINKIMGTDIKNKEIQMENFLIRMSYNYRKRSFVLV